MATGLSATLDTVDLLVVGAGAAGMTAALVAAHAGLRVLLCEATQQVGGTSATSAGTLWIPGNRHGAAAGHADRIEDADRYLQALCGPEDARGLRRAYLDSGNEAVEWLEAHSQVRFTSAGVHPDYLELPGAAAAGRALSSLPFDGRLLGRDFARIRPPIAEFLLLGGMMVSKADVAALVRRWSSPRALLHSAGLVARHALDRLRYPRGTRLVMGNALVARLFASVRAAPIELRFGWRLQALVFDPQRCVGARFETDTGLRSVTVARAVVLACGGVGHHAGMRRELLAAGESAPSLMCASVRGEGISAARDVGAVLERHEDSAFFWQPVSRVAHAGRAPGLFPHLFLDRAKPGLIAVDARGQRFVDEACSYHHFVLAMRARIAQTGQIGAWLVCDATFVRRYGLGAIAPGTRRLERWVSRGYVSVGQTLAELARRAGIDGAALAATVQDMNRAAQLGVDPVFGKGSTRLDRFNGDPAHRPNPCLGPIAQPPFVALPILAADAASSAGLATDADGRVLNAAGEPLAGLYACGNDAASVMRGTYPGPGASLGPAIVFGYRAARHAARPATAASGSAPGPEAAGPRQERRGGPAS